MSTCPDCSTSLAPTNKSGRCSPCGNRYRECDPDFRARRLTGIRRSFEDPARRAVAAKIMRRVGKAALERPDHRAWMIEHGKMLYRNVLTQPDVVEKTKAAATKAYRESAYWLAKAHPLDMPSEGGIGLRFDFHPPDKRRRDLDNMLASIKGAIDGIADAHEVNDQRFGFWLSREAPVKGGCVIVTVVE